MKVEAWECDNCGAQSADGLSEFILQCEVCDKDFCFECRVQHARDECWSGRE